MLLSQRMGTKENSPARAGFADSLVTLTERLLTFRLKRKLKEKARQQKRHPLVDWAAAILWAACVVLVINQYIFQNYRIPSESMVDSLLIGDMIFVDKFSLGPELLPGVAKLPGLSKPGRGQVVVFENPTYLSRGPLFTIAQQFLYMLTLTMVDIDRDQNGEQRVHYLIKRMVGAPGDRIRVKDGEVYIRPEGLDAYLPEKRLMGGLGLPFRATRSVSPETYDSIRAVGVAAAYAESGLGVPGGPGTAQTNVAYQDAFEFDATRVATLADMDPSDQRVAASAARYAQGWFIAPGRIFPMGDNRDNSRDARYFGPVKNDRVLGRALFIYWPFGRAGRIR